MCILIPGETPWAAALPRMMLRSSNSGRCYNHQIKMSSCCIEASSPAVREFVFVGIAGNTKTAMREPGHQSVERFARDMDQSAVITSFEIDIALSFEALVNDRAQPIGGRDRRHRAGCTVGKQ